MATIEHGPVSRELATAELVSRCHQQVRAAAAGAWVIDATGRTALANVRMAELLGTTVESMQGRPFTDHLTDPQREQALAYLSKCQRGAAEQHDFEFVHCSGGSICLSLAAWPVWDADGCSIGVMALASDISAQRRSQRDLQQQLQLSQATLDSLTAHVCVLDDAGTIVAVNRAWMSFANANGGAAGVVGVGANYLAICRGASGRRSEEAPEFTLGLLDVLDGRRQSFELQYPCHSPAEQRWFMVNVSRLENCAPARVVVAHQAVTKRILAEARMREAQKLESLGTLASGIAHDFNNILAAILGNASLALDPLAPGHPARPRIEHISVAARRARQLVQQILAFGRRQTRSAEPMALQPLVEETIDLLRGTLPAEVHIAAELDDEPISVLADATQIQQVLMNLGTNAWHALQGGPGRIGIRLTRRPADSNSATATPPSPWGWAVLSVSDNGVGMDQALRERIFEPFFTTQPQGQGTGLGLAIVHGIVGKHGGHVTVDTAPGQGSTFHVHLPMLDQPQPIVVAAQPSLEAADIAGCRVICIDDDPVVGTVVQALLERAGCLVQYHSVPALALQAIAAQPDAVDLVVTDHSMPALSGLQVAAELARIRPDLPVILLSGYIADPMVERALALGIREVLRKESALEELPAAVARVRAGTAR